MLAIAQRKGPVPRGCLTALVAALLVAGCGDGPSGSSDGGGARDGAARDAAPPVDRVAEDAPRPGDGPSADGADAASPTGCAALGDFCRGKQQICVETGGSASCQPCPVDKYAGRNNQCQPLAGTPLSHDFADFTVNPGEEVLGLCQSWTLNNAEELWVNAVELVQNVASHHSNWTFVPDDKFPGPDGVWTCRDRSYDQLSAAAVGGVLYAQSTQAAHEVQKFPDGAAVRIPPYSRIIVDVHLLNAVTRAVSGHVSLKVYGIPLAQVTTKLVPFHLTYDGLNIPPHATSRFTGSCLLKAPFETQGGVPFDPKIFFILPHTHAMATRFFLEVIGGPLDGMKLIEIDGFDSEAHGRAYDPPVDLAGADGLRFGCEYENPRDVSVHWGFGDQEMCELLGFADQKAAYESSVATADPAGMDGDTFLFTGDCSTLVLPWDFNRPGGPGPM